MAMKDDVYKSFNSKTTDELQKIWDENDRNEYSVVTFEAIEEILKGRNVHVKSLEKSIESQKEIEGGFWSFDKMVSGSLIKILYILGLLSITISGFLMFQNSDLIFFGIIIIVLGNLLWRIICEGIIIIFKIFEKLNQIEKKVN